jgi:hypothetical protein
LVVWQATASNLFLSRPFILSRPVDTIESNFRLSVCRWCLTALERLTRHQPSQTDKSLFAVSPAVLTSSGPFGAVPEFLPILDGLPGFRWTRVELFGRFKSVCALRPYRTSPLAGLENQNSIYSMFHKADEIDSLDCGSVHSVCLVLSNSLTSSRSLSWPA